MRKQHFNFKNQGWSKKYGFIDGLFSTGKNLEEKSTKNNNNNKVMSIEIQFNLVIVDPQELQEQSPGLISALYSYLPKRKTPKRRKPRKKKETVGSLIQEIIDDLEK